MSDIIQRLRDSYAENPASALNLLPELFQAEENGKIKEVDEQFALAMGAGARAISQNKQGKYGMTYIWDVFGVGKEIPYCVAARLLEESAEEALKDRDFP